MSRLTDQFVAINLIIFVLYFRFVFHQEDSTIFDLAVEVDGKVIKGKCKEKEEAFARYDDSISSGHNAFLLEAG